MKLTFKNIESAIILKKIKRLEFKIDNKKHHSKTSNQHLLLNEIFKISPYPSKQVRMLLGDLLNYDSSRPIQIWFQNKRQLLKIKRRDFKRREDLEKTSFDIINQYKL